MVDEFLRFREKRGLSLAIEFYGRSIRTGRAKHPRLERNWNIAFSPPVCVGRSEPQKLRGANSLPQPSLKPWGKGEWGACPLSQTTSPPENVLLELSHRLDLVLLPIPNELPFFLLRLPNPEAAERRELRIGEHVGRD